MALTTRQQEVLSFINQYIATEGYSPTRNDIAKAFGFTATGAHFHLLALQKKGAIEITPKVRRGIKVLS